MNTKLFYYFLLLSGLLSNKFMYSCIAVQKKEIIAKPVNPNINTQDKYGNTPLHNAVIQNQIETVRKLLSYAELKSEIKNIDGLTPLFYAASNGNASIVELFRKHNADTVLVNIQDFDGETALHWACSLGLENVTFMLLQFTKINVTLKNSSGQTPLEIALKNGNRVIVELIENKLLEKE